MIPCPIKKEIYKYNLFTCPGEDAEIPIIIPPTVKADITDKMTIEKTDPMLIVLFMIFGFLGIHIMEITSSYFDKEKMIY
jgi:hypothetical protein|tara:strand:- start:2636 stop:2875 length:240 start_codon:yes stop_codon:yes gene_type:complete